MTVTVQNTATTNTFDFWRNRTNELAAAMSTLVITTNGSTTSGNATVNGYFTANGFIGGNVQANFANLTTVNTSSVTVGSATINTTAIALGSVSVNTTALSVNTSITVGNSSANIVITSPSAAQISNGQYFLSANSSWALLQASYTPVSNGTYSTTGTSTVVVDSWLKSAYNVADYTLAVLDGSTSSKHFSKLTLVNDSTGGISTEYAVIAANGTLGTWSSGSNTTHILLNFTPSVFSTSIKFARIIA